MRKLTTAKIRTQIENKNALTMQMKITLIANLCPLPNEANISANAR